MQRVRRGIDATRTPADTGQETKATACKYHGKGEARCKRPAFMDWKYCVKHGSCKAEGCVKQKADGARDWCQMHRRKFEAESQRRRGEKLKTARTEEPSLITTVDSHSAAIALLAGRDPFR